ncbi:MOSC domain-containing protein [soil metagenome]
MARSSPAALQAQITSVLIGRHPLLDTLAEKHAFPHAGYLEKERVSEIQVTMEGFEGDRHADMTLLANGHTPMYRRGTVIRNSRQVSLVSLEELQAVAEALDVPEILPEWLGANLTIQGVPHFSQLPPGTRLVFPEQAVLAVEGENEPCVFPGKAIQHHNRGKRGLAARFPKAAIHRRGIVAWVERSGVIREGDTVDVILPPPSPHYDMQ